MTCTLFSGATVVDGTGAQPAEAEVDGDPLDMSTLGDRIHAVYQDGVMVSG